MNKARQQKESNNASNDKGEQQSDFQTRLALGLLQLTPNFIQ